MVEILQSLFDAIKAPFALFGDIIGYIRYFVRYIIDAFHSVISIDISGLPAIFVLCMTIAFTFGVIRLVINRRE